MGVCISKGSIASPPPPPGGVREQANPPLSIEGDEVKVTPPTVVESPVCAVLTNKPPPEVESSLDKVTQLKEPESSHDLIWAKHIVERELDEVPPEEFHPKIVLSQQELDCRALIHSIEPENLEYEDSPFEVINKWENHGILTEITSHVFSISANSAGTVKELALGLTADGSKYLEHFEDAFSRHLAMAFALYIWITNNIAFDTNQWESQRNGESPAEEEDDPHAVLESRTGTATTFATLYNALCSEAGLIAEKADGNIRQWRSITGTTFEPNTSNYHSWNIVTIEDAKIIVDPMLGSGYISSSMSFVKKLSRYYFAIPPYYSILTHWPSQVSHQCLEKPIALNDFQMLIPVDMLSLGLGISPFSWSEVIDIAEPLNSDPVASVLVQTKQKEALVVAQLIPLTSPQTFEAIELQRLVFVEENSEKSFHIKAVLPMPGKFVLNIYLNNTAIGNDYLHLSYIVNCEITRGKMVGFPTCSPLAARPFNFKMLHWNRNKRSYNCVHSGKDTFPIVFEVKKNTSFYHCITQGQIDVLSMNQPGSILHHNTMLVSNSKGQYQLLVVFPSKGWWTIHLSGTELGEDEEIVSGYTTLLNYNLYVEEGRPEFLYPHVLMPRLFFFSNDPIVAPRNAPLRLKCVALKHVEFYVECKELATGQETSGTQEAIDLAFNGKYGYQLNAAFPRPGTWSMHAYSKESHDEQFSKAFDLKLDIQEALSNTCLLHVSKELEGRYGINFTAGDLITFMDDEKPFTLTFTGPTSGIDFHHAVRLQDQDQDESIDYRSYLFSQTEESDRELTAYNLGVVFPDTGQWMIELYARETREDNYTLLSQVKLDVHKPTPNLCYPKIFSAFRNLGMVIRQTDTLIDANSTTGEMKLHFQAPEDIHFVWNLHNTNTSDTSQLAYLHHMPNTKKVFHAILTELGEWQITLFAKRKGSNEDGEAVMQLSVNNLESKNGFSFPQLFESFHDLHMTFASEDLPIPSVVNIENAPQIVSLNFYCSSGINFLHYALLRKGDSERSNAQNRKLTKMTSNSESGLHQLQVDVVDLGQWTVYLFAENYSSSSSSDLEWIPLLQYRFSAIRAD